MKLLSSLGLGLFEVFFFWLWPLGDFRLFVFRSLFEGGFFSRRLICVWLF